jgi:hypothetical protein
MDIIPKPPSSPEIQSSRPQSTDPSIISNIEDLKLDTNKVYRARVQQELPSKTPTHLENQAPKTPESSQAVKEWLLNISGKLVKTSGNLPIKIGEQLLVRLELTADQKTSALVIIGKPNQKNSLNVDHQAINTTLVNTLSKLLPKQVSLSSGFAALSKISNMIPSTSTEALNKFNQASSTISTNHNQTSTKLSPELSITKSVIENLISALPKAEQITQGSPLTQSNTSGKIDTNVHTIQQILTRSGAFLEASLLSTDTRKELSSQLQNIRNLALQLNNEAPQTIYNKLAAYLQSPSQNQDFTTSKSSKEVLNLLQSIVGQGENKPSQLDGKAKSIPQDLKAALIGFSQLISLSQSGNAQAPKILESMQGQVLEPDLLTSPFNFPRIQTEASAKAQALLADQELSTGQLLKILAGMINRIQFNQLNSLYQSQNSDGNTLQSWFLELPVAGSNQQVTTFDIRLDQEKNPSAGHDNESENQALQWKLTLSFDLENLGAMYIQVSLRPPDISSIIWADKDMTYQLAQSEIKTFKSKLSDLGLDVGDIICQKGLPPQQATKLTQSLVDVQA